jgi:hypothetical protein
MEDNIVIKKMWDKWYWEINKELLRDAVNRYSIKIEVNSSSFDDIESRREDSLAFANIMSLAASQWVPIDLQEVYKEVIGTFEKKDINRFIKQANPLEQLMPQIWWQPAIWTKKEKPMTESSALTEQVAQWNITSWIK